ncbi:Oidioi.mRNA.OKI2018_I69.XSR.g16764.t1.cds [Oikopleura dioica]|uniref:Oidioi.mRNA.OKI2018_I69.XSR.g16764.t1.cds n=1 Tax=Oikopleura dioica TaxID=34765 RepID=A0ABN7SH60_OIKDI|nr:Oidioi.mRNA.OKI2018_I69.XSR.g16764.t1.cds [Oikopleura dioica]
MTAKEQHESLAKIFAKVDSNQNQTIEYEEIHQWMHKLEDHIVKRDVKISFPKFDINGNGLVDENELLQTLGINENEVEHESLYLVNVEIFRAADEDKDLQLSELEFGAFLFPRNYERTKYLFVKEFIADLDSNHDGMINFEEYLMQYDIDLRKEISEDEAPRVELERRTFSFHDKTKNGLLEGSELDELVDPPGISWFDGEIRHLINTADLNDDEGWAQQPVFKT